MNEEIVKPRNRKYPELYTLYQMWVEINKLRTRMSNRIGAIDRGESNMDKGFASVLVDGGQWRARKLTASGNIKEMDVDTSFGLSGWQEYIQKEMHVAASYHPMWGWLTSISGVAGNNAAKLLALVDDIERFDTIASLWRYSGYGIFNYWIGEDGKVKAPEYGYKSKRKTANGEEITVRWMEYAEPEDGWELRRVADPPKMKRPSGWNAPDNTVLKSHLYVINEGMIRAQKAKYVEFYYDARKKYDEQGKTKGHSHNSAFRIMSKELLKDFWLEFREVEGLPISDAWA